MADQGDPRGHGFDPKGKGRGFVPTPSKGKVDVPRPGKGKADVSKSNARLEALQRLAKGG